MPASACTSFLPSAASLPRICCSRAAPQELAHLYHYYLHGGQGNRGAGGSAAMREGRLPNGEPFPDIVLRYQARRGWVQHCASARSSCNSNSDTAQKLARQSAGQAGGWQAQPLAQCRAWSSGVCALLQVDARLVWEQRLAEVEDDMETKLLRAQQAELPFTLQVPDKVRGCGRGLCVRPARVQTWSAELLAGLIAGPAFPATCDGLSQHASPQPLQGIVCGVLYYYPFQNDQETVPVENLQTSTKPASSPPFHGGRGTQAAPTQLPRGTQAPPRGTQLGSGGAAALDEDEEAEALGSWQLAPIFEAFWQGRLIPGARIDTLPFVEAVRSKRNAQAKVRSEANGQGWAGGTQWLSEKAW